MKTAEENCYLMVKKLPKYIYFRYKLWILNSDLFFFSRKNYLLKTDICYKKQKRKTFYNVKRSAQLPS